jgi:hypothetical protein
MFEKIFGDSFQDKLILGFWDTRLQVIRSAVAVCPFCYGYLTSELKVIRDTFTISPNGSLLAMAVWSRGAMLQNTIRDD